jgi:hypothetical protein
MNNNTNTNVKMDWKKVYFGKIERSDIKKYTPEAAWQTVRIFMKGKDLQTKYKALTEWLDLKGHAHSAKVQVTNYTTALSRGGLIKPEEYREV